MVECQGCFDRFICEACASLSQFELRACSDICGSIALDKIRAESRALRSERDEKALRVESLLDILFQIRDFEPDQRYPDVAPHLRHSRALGAIRMLAKIAIAISQRADFPFSAPLAADIRKAVDSVPSGNEAAA